MFGLEEARSCIDSIRCSVYQGGGKKVKIWFLGEGFKTEVMFEGPKIRLESQRGRGRGRQVSNASAFAATCSDAI